MNSSETPCARHDSPVCPLVIFSLFKRFSSAQKAQRAVLVLLLVLLIPAQPGFAGPPLERLTNSNLSADPENTRYGLLGVLDSRSQYGLGVLPEPFLVDDSDLEVNELRLDTINTRLGPQHADLFKMELEKGFGPVTFELELLYERDSSSGLVSEGVNSVNLGARVPIYQFVSGPVDTTIGIGAEVALPVNTSRSRNTEVVPKIFDDLIVGEHFTLQAIFGYSTLFGPGPDRNAQTFESGFVFGYAFQHEELPLPDVQKFIPMFELKGETRVNKRDTGRTNLLGDAGFRANLKAIGPVQPRLGFSFIFPLNDLARSDQHWGTITSLVFDF